MNELSLPDGFRPLHGIAAFLDTIGPLYVKSVGKSRVIAVRVAAKHLNMRGIAHGGMLVTLADSALGINLSYRDDPPRPMVTVSLASDFLEPAKEGEWLEAHVQIQRMGAHLAFASCNLDVGAKTVLRASGVFFILAEGILPVPGNERFDG